MLDINTRVYVQKYHTACTRVCTSLGTNQKQNVKI